MLLLVMLAGVTDGRSDDGNDAGGAYFHRLEPTDSGTALSWVPILSPPGGPTGDAVAAPVGGDRLFPRVIHRSHRFEVSDIQTHAEHKRLRRNLLSCADMNQGFDTFYYTDAQVNKTMHTLLRHLNAAGTHSKAAGRIKRAWSQLYTHATLRQVQVLKVDVFRLAAVFLSGGWWLDCDAVCIDPIDDTFDMLRPHISSAITASQAMSVDTSAAVGVDDKFQSMERPSCVFAWEGDIEATTSSPLNWAFGCEAGAPVLLHVLSHIAGRLLRWVQQEGGSAAPTTVPESERAFCAPARGPGGKQVLVPVLHLTGPAALESAVDLFSRRVTGEGLQGLRRRAGEVHGDKSTWDRMAIIGNITVQPVVVLPYCFFRSRGCPHLHERFEDRVIFHHEFDTSWRPSFWHNYMRLEDEDEN